MGKKHLQLAIVNAKHQQSSTDTGHRRHPDLRHREKYRTNDMILVVSRLSRMYVVIEKPKLKFSRWPGMVGGKPVGDEFPLKRVLSDPHSR
jgi:hypothetical protein